MKQIPIILITKNKIFFPKIRKRLIIEKETSKATVDYAYQRDKKVAFLFEKQKINKNIADFYKYAVVGEIIQFKKEFQSEKEVYVVDFYMEEKVLVPHISELKNEKILLLNEYIPFVESEDKIHKDNVFKLAQYVKEYMQNLVFFYDKINFDDGFITTESIATLKDIERYTYEIVSGLSLENEVFYDYLKELNIERVLFKLLEYLKGKKIFCDSISNIEKKIERKSQDEDKILYLKEQIKNYQKELNEIIGIKEGNDLEFFENRLEAIRFFLNENDYYHLKKEINKIQSFALSDQESNKHIEYLNTVFSVPFVERTEINKNLNLAKEVLENHHFGMNKVKEKIIENLAINNISKSHKSAIICLLGPPGVGKTSFGESIAQATNRKMVRISLGGIQDEADIRGHRRTYVGSKEGRIVSALKEAKVKNPLILLDEIDKIKGGDQDNEVASALLEVLDYGQNKNFRDHFLEIGIDLSEVMFVTTANSLNIPSALLDRMDVISLTGYTENEKLNIVKKHLLPKILNELNVEKFKINDEAVLSIINNYTLESGVRNLERLIFTFVSKIVTEFMLSNHFDVDNVELSKEYTGEDVLKFLGQPYIFHKKIDNESRVGVVNGLAWSPSGGSVLKIESVKTNGSGKMLLTGQLGDVMKESAKAAMTIIKSQYSEAVKDINANDLHIHLPEGAIPKDGPSAGVALVISILSSLINVKIKNDVAMTGEINLSGDVLPVGGIKEKVLAAIRSGVKTVIIPKENENDLVEIKDEIKNKINIKLVEKINESVNIAFEKDININLERK